MYTLVHSVVGTFFCTLDTDWRIRHCVQGDVREAAGLGPWEVISAGPASGAAIGAVTVAALSTMQGQSAGGGGKGARVVFSAELGGLEDVPPGVVAVLTTSPVDLLSHIAIRARNSGVLLATCADSAVWDKLVSEHDGKTVEVSAGPAAGDVTVAPASASAATGGGGGHSGNGAAPKLARPDQSSEWALPSSSFRQGAVGGKSLGRAAPRDARRRLWLRGAASVCAAIRHV